MVIIEFWEIWNKMNKNDIAKEIVYYLNSDYCYNGTNKWMIKISKMVYIWIY